MAGVGAEGDVGLSVGDAGDAVELAWDDVAQFVVLGTLTIATRSNSPVTE